MAKQSFVTGQVLTAQQVNDLQTNDFNQTVSAKTASYTLVAADKGTRITMSSTSATTITVNTGLFAAGDTLFIQNLNTGVATITAGTATVDTSASLALAQHEGGTLYFTSAGASTFFKAAGATASSGGMTLLSTTTLSGASTTISSIDQTYKDLLMIISTVNISTTGSFNLELNGTTQSIGTSGTDQNAVIDEPTIGYIGLRGNQSNMLTGNTDNAFFCTINNYASTTLHKTYNACARFVKSAGTPAANNHGGGIIMTSAISSLKFSTTGTFSAGTVLLYGVK